MNHASLLRSPRLRPSLRRALRRALTLLAALLAIITLTTSPALAAAQGGGSGPGGGGGSKGSSDGYFYCQNGLGWVGYHNHPSWPSSPIFEQSSPVCTDSRGVSSHQDRLCDVGYDVFRFYSRNDHIVAWSTSRSYLNNRCASTPGIFFFPSPDDAGAVPPGTSPWRSSFNTNAWGQPVTTAANGLPTSNPPFNAQGSCTSIQSTSDPIAPFFSTQRYIPGSARVRSNIYAYYGFQAAIGGGWNGLAATNSNLTQGRFPNSGDELNYGRNVNCGSDFQFYWNASDPSTRNTFGTCWVPIDERAAVFTHSNGSFAGYGYYLPRLQNRGGPGPWEGGERYETNGAPRQGSTYDNPTYRNMISSIVSQNPDQHPAQSYNHNASTPVPPADGNLAARQAAHYATCVKTSGTSVKTDNPVKTSPAPATLDLVVSAPSSLQATGSVSPSTLSVTQGQLWCQVGNRSEPCSATYSGRTDQPYIDQLHFGLQLTPTNGYNVCVTPSGQSTSSSCDSAMPPLASRLPQTHHNAGTNSSAPNVYVDSSQTATISSYSATGHTPDQVIHLEVNGGALGAAAWGTQEVPVTSANTISVCAGSPQNSENTDQTCSDIDITSVTWEQRPLPIRLVNPDGSPWSPQDLRVVGATDQHMR